MPATKPATTRPLPVRPQNDPAEWVPNAGPTRNFPCHDDMHDLHARPHCGRDDSTTADSFPIVDGNNHVSTKALTCFTAELCAGSAGLSLALHRCGFKVCPVDHQHNRHIQKVPVLVLDLSRESGWDILYEMLENERLLYVHCAPPCGTATRAREKRVPERLRKRGSPDPQPLRSERHPEGLPSLSGLDKQKVLQANEIYRLSYQRCAGQKCVMTLM